MKADYNWEYGYIRTPFWTGKECVVIWRTAGPYDFKQFVEFPSQEELDAAHERALAAVDRATGAKP